MSHVVHAQEPPRRVAARVPLPLKLVIILFGVMALYGAVATSQGRFALHPLIIGAPIAWGLWRLKPGWRLCAIGVGAVQITVTVYASIMYFLGGFELWNSLSRSVAANRALFLLLLAVVLHALAMLWSIGILRSARIRGLFLASPTDQIASAIGPALLLGGVLFIARLSGGLEGVAWNIKSAATSGSGFGILPLGDTIIQPLVVEIRSGEERFYYLLAWLHSRELTKSGRARTKTVSHQKRYSGVFIPNAIRREPHKVIVTIEEKTTGLNWLPLVKMGVAKGRAKISGEGRYASLNYTMSEELKYTVWGLSSPKSIRNYARRRLERASLKQLRSAALDGRRLEFYERLCRQLPLGSRSVINQARALRSQAHAYRRQGKVQDADALNRRAILTLKIQLAKEEILPQLSRRTKSLNGELATTYNDMAWAYATDPRGAVRNGREAEALAEQACELSKWKAFRHLETLAAARAESGAFESAVELQKTAIKLLPPEDRTEVKSAHKGDQQLARQRLALYEEGKPYRTEQMAVE